MSFFYLLVAWPNFASTLKFSLDSVSIICVKSGKPAMYVNQTNSKSFNRITIICLRNICANSARRGSFEVLWSRKTGRGNCSHHQAILIKRTLLKETLTAWTGPYTDHKIIKTSIEGGEEVVWRWSLQNLIQPQLIFWFNVTCKFNQIKSKEVKLHYKVVRITKSVSIFW